MANVPGRAIFEISSQGRSRNCQVHFRRVTVAERRAVVPKSLGQAQRGVTSCSIIGILKKSKGSFETLHPSLDIGLPEREARPWAIGLPNYLSRCSGGKWHVSLEPFLDKRTYCLTLTLQAPHRSPKAFLPNRSTRCSGKHRVELKNNWETPNSHTNANHPPTNHRVTPCEGRTLCRTTCVR